MSCSSVHVHATQHQQKEQSIDNQLLIKPTAGRHSYCSTASSDSSSSSSSSSNNTVVVEEKKREDPAACIFVASLNKSIGDEELQRNVFIHFRKWGNLLGVKVFKDWLKRPYAFVQYESVADSKTALKEAPGTILNGRSVRCEPARVNRSICLVSLNCPFNKKYLQEVLVDFGEIEDVSVLQPQGKFHSVFIKFKYRDDAIKAFLTLKYADYRTLQLVNAANTEQQWFVEWASNLDINNLYGFCNDIITSNYGSAYYRLDKCSIFIGNLPETVTEESLKTKFEQYGTVKRIHIIRKPYYSNHRNRRACHDNNNDGHTDGNNRDTTSNDEVQSDPSRVFAFIKYFQEQHALDAIDQENGNLFKERILRVCYRQYYIGNNGNNRYQQQQQQQQQLDSARTPGMIAYYPPQSNPAASSNGSPKALAHNAMSSVARTFYQVTGIGYYDVSALHNKHKQHHYQSEENECPLSMPYLFYPIDNRGLYEPYMMTPTANPAMMSSDDPHVNGYSQTPISSAPLHHKMVPASLPSSPPVDCFPGYFPFPAVPPTYATAMNSTANSNGEDSNDQDAYYTSNSHYTAQAVPLPPSPSTNDTHPYQGFSSVIPVFPASAVPPYNNSSGHHGNSNAEGYMESAHPAVIYYAYPPTTSACHYQRPYRANATHGYYNKKSYSTTSASQTPSSNSIEGTKRTFSSTMTKSVATSSASSKSATAEAPSDAGINPMHVEKEDN